MEHAGTQIKCVARLDRLRVSSWAKRGMPVPKVRGFKTVRNIRLRRRDKPLVYGRVCEMRSETSATTAFWQHDRRRGWVKHWRVTMVADDQTGLTARDAWSVFKHFRFPKLLLFELALDFFPSSGVDADFVRQHALFGKSRFRPDRGGPGQLRYGSRFSGKLARCYTKQSVNAFRVEVELHSTLLPRPIKGNRQELLESRWPDIADAGLSIVPAHLKFVEFRFKKLRAYLRRRFGDHGEVLYEKTRVRAASSLHSAMAYLRRQGVSNPHRFLMPHPMNSELERAVERWVADFLRPCHDWERAVDQEGQNHAHDKHRDRQ